MEAEDKEFRTLQKDIQLVPSAWIKINFTANA